MGIEYYNMEPAHLLGHRPEHKCAPAIHYQMDLIIKDMCCKAEHTINLKFVPQS